MWGDIAIGTCPLQPAHTACTPAANKAFLPCLFGPCLMAALRRPLWEGAIPWRSSPRLSIRQGCAWAQRAKITTAAPLMPLRHAGFWGNGGALAACCGDVHPRANWRIAVVETPAANTLEKINLITTGKEWLHATTFN